MGENIDKIQMDFLTKKSMHDTKIIQINFKK